MSMTNEELAAECEDAAVTINGEWGCADPKRAKEYCPELYEAAARLRSIDRLLKALGRLARDYRPGNDTADHVVEIASDALDVYRKATGEE